MSTINGDLISHPFMPHYLNMTGGPFNGVSDPQGSSRISAHLILLPKGLLPVALSDTIGLRGGRKTSELPW